MIFSQVINQRRYITQALVIGNKYFGPVNRYILFIDKGNCVAGKVKGTEKA